jgi:hypothetical protein
MNYKVRKPTKSELEQLKRFIEEHRHGESAGHLIENYYFAVLEGYTSDCPGYCGKLLLAVYGLPEFHQLYGWIGGRLVEIQQDRGGR